MTTPCGLLTPADRTDKRAAEATQQEEPMALSNVLCSVLSFFFFSSHQQLCCIPTRFHLIALKDAINVPYEPKGLSSHQKSNSGLEI